MAGRAKEQALDVRFDLMFEEGYVERYPSPAVSRRNSMTMSSEGEENTRPLIDEEYESTTYLTDEDKISKRLSLLTSSSHRLRSYTVESNNYSYISLAVRSFPHGPAPDLTSFEIRYVKNSPDETVNRWSTVHLPCFAPRLRKLVLSGVNLPSSSSCQVRGLEYLEIGNQEIAPSMLCSTISLHVLLSSNATTLRTLVLDDSGHLGLLKDDGDDRQWDWVDRDEEIAELPVLEKLVVRRQRADFGEMALRRICRSLKGRRRGLKEVEVDPDMAGMELPGERMSSHDGIVRALIPLLKGVETLRVGAAYCSEQVAREFVDAVLASESVRVERLRKSRGLCGGDGGTKFEPEACALADMLEDVVPTRS